MKVRGKLLKMVKWRWPWFGLCNFILLTVSHLLPLMQTLTVLIWQSGDGKWRNLPVVWALSFGAKIRRQQCLCCCNVCGESHNMNSDDGDIVNKTQNFEAVLQYQFDFWSASIGYFILKHWT